MVGEGGGEGGREVENIHEKLSNSKCITALSAVGSNIIFNNERII